MGVLLSVNVPIGGKVKQVISELHPDLVSFTSVRERHTLVCKRFPGEEGSNIDQLESELRVTLRGMESFEVRVDGIGFFEEPVSGSAPVVYLGVTSDGLERLHWALVDAFGSVPALEGSSYVPHITLARGGDLDKAVELSNRNIDPVVWVVNEVWLWEGKYGERVRAISLPV